MRAIQTLLNDGSGWGTVVLPATSKWQQWRNVLVLADEPNGNFPPEGDLGIVTYEVSFGPTADVSRVFALSNSMALARPPGSACGH
ncbi:hypothetical protein EV130_109301 [Rhizobium azibense]|uniref:Uncharacterized protein n=1 Tax=Rhizobium azibense TaxID=1136135 RepID=A0A4R3QMQ9_9HYPH|nr:hypothetical protein [Rhizobium azibense]TCU22504.1 hypothetical protein EV130_109301 [Rhizobium azibense]